MPMAIQEFRVAQKADSAHKTVVLVVDDDPIQRRVISRIAVQAGHSVREASSVEEASSIISSEAIDALTVDLSLGERSGAEILSALSRRVRGLPVLIISGMPDFVLQSATRCAEQGGLNVHATFAKPLDLARLRKALAEVQEICAVRAQFDAPAD